MNKFLNGLTREYNLTHTENGALTHKTTNSALLDMFAMGAAMRTRSDEDVILMFKNAFEENDVYALKCLFYIRDVRGGQGERRFFKVCMKYLANKYPHRAKALIDLIPVYGRWDDLYCFVDTAIETEVFDFLNEVFRVDLVSKTPSLLGKWLKSENANSAETRRLGNITRKYFGLSHKEYRQALSALRKKINLLERLMSAGDWEKIEFDKIPSKAGLKYRNAFARHDVERAKASVRTYEEFAKDSTTKVNAKTLYPYECTKEAKKVFGRDYDDTTRLMVNKYWENLEDYFNGCGLNALAVVDTSGSMWGLPIEVATSLGLYCAEKAKGLFANHFITFSSKPSLIKVEGIDFVDKVKRMMRADWGMTTNIKAVFDLLLENAIRNDCSQAEIPQNIIIISDMEFDSCAYIENEDYIYRGYRGVSRKKVDSTLFEEIEREWNCKGYEMPHLIFWNVNARQNNIPSLGQGPISFVSGFSPSIFNSIISGKTGYDLMMEKLNSPRYDAIR